MLSGSVYFDINLHNKRLWLRRPAYDYESAAGVASN